MLRKIIIILMLTIVQFMSVTELVQAEAVKVKALILPKFEIGELTGDFPGEAQKYYEAYFMNSDAYDIKGGAPGSKLYVNRDGLAMYVNGVGKLRNAIMTTNILNDSRFDFSQAYIISVGCGGSAIEYATMGDVVIGSATVDYDRGHSVDSRELLNSEAEVTWFPSTADDRATCSFMLNQCLVDKVYNLVKNVKIYTTPKTRAFMAKNFSDAKWAVREPKVLRGTIVTSDNYWKGIYGHNNALAKCKAYNCPDPFAITEMEDHAVATAVERSGLLDRYIVIRVSVNTDVFMNGETPESMWNESFMSKVQKKGSAELADIFQTAMENNFAVGSIVIDNILHGTLVF